MAQGDRDNVIMSFKRKEIPILVATDVAGRWDPAIAWLVYHTCMYAHYILLDLAIQAYCCMICEGRKQNSL